METVQEKWKQHGRNQIRKALLCTHPNESKQKRLPHFDSVRMKTKKNISLQFSRNGNK
jgi:hypothetical protein